MFEDGRVKDLYKMRGEDRSGRGIAKELGVSRNMVCKYVRSLAIPKAKVPRTPRALDESLRHFHRAIPQENFWMVTLCHQDLMR